MIRAGGILAATLVLGGCFGGPAGPTRPAIPPWVTKPPEATGLLYAVGSGTDREAALANARQELASQVQLDIHAETENADRYESRQATGGARVESLTAEARSRVRTRAALSDLPGVTVDRQEIVNGTTYVLVRLDRSLWAAELRGRLTAANERLVGLERELVVTPATSPAERLNLLGRLLAELLPALAERDEAERRLRLAEPGLAPSASPIDRQRWTTRLGNLLDQLQVGLPTGTPERDALAPALTRALAKVGLRGTTAPDAPLALDLTLTLRTQTIGEQIRCDGSLVGARGLTPAAGGRRLGGISLADRASSTQADAARDRAIAKLADKLAKDLADRLPGMLSGRADD